MPIELEKYQKREGGIDLSKYQRADTVAPGPDDVVPFASEFQQPAPTEETAHPLKPLFDLMGFTKEKADIRIPGTETEVLGHKFPGETRRRLFEPIPNPKSDPVISVTNALKGFLGLTPDIPEFFLKDIPEAALGTFTPEDELKPEDPAIGRITKQLGRSTIDVMALAVMRQLHPEEYKRFIKTDRGKAIKEMEAERLHEAALGPLIFSGGLAKAAKLTGKLGKAKPTGILSDIIPKERISTERVPIVEEILGVEKAKAPKDITLYRGVARHQTGKNYYSPDKEFARQFTQSGLDSEIKTIKISPNEIYRPKELPDATRLSDIDLSIIQEAKNKGYKGVWMDEGLGQPESVYMLSKPKPAAPSPRGVKPELEVAKGEVRPAPTPKPVVKEPWEMSATSKEWAELPIDKVDKAAFGFARKDIKSIMPDKLNIKWKEDIKNPIEQQKKSGLSPKEWAETIDISEPIQLSFKDGKFWVEDGHHRYYAAKILKKPLRVSDINIIDKPHKAIVEKALSEGKPVPAEVLKDYPDLKPQAVTPKVPLPKVEPVKPVGETAESLLAIRTEADAIAKKLTSDFGELPQYKTMNMGEQARQAQNIIAKDYTQAKRMAMGQELPPAGLREASIYEGVKLRALKEGDVQTLMELATESEIPTKLSEYGQAIKAADSKIMSDPVKVMQDISNTRIERSKRIGRKSTNAEVERLRGELETLQKTFDERASKVTKRTPVKYGSKNRIVSQATYEKARREIIKSMNTLTANPIFNPEIVANAAKVGTYHLEAGTRVFADWSGRMVNDLGDWVKPHLEDIWKQVKEDKKLRTALKTQKTRLINETETFTNKLESLDFTKQERRKLSLDKEARELKRARDRAKEDYNAALNTSKSVSKAEAQKIVELSRLTEEARVAMEQGGDRYKYGAARVAYENYVNELKGDKAKLKTQLRERGQEFKTTFKEHKTKAVFDVGKDALKVIRDNSVAIVASWDNSFMGRQGLKTLMTHPTVWAKGAGKSFTDFAKTLGGKKTHDALMADIYSRKNYLNESYQKAKILTRAEEEYPTSLPERIPGLGRVFKASENAFTGSAIRMRTGLFDLLNKRAKENGIDVTSKAHLEPLGKMINSLTARGQWGKRGEPAIVRVFLWAPKMIKGNLDVLTAHGAGVGLKSKFARRQAAINLTKIVAETATVLAIADALHPGSVEWDPRSTKFGRITIGDTTYDITGGAGSYVVLAARLLTNERKNLKGKVKEFGAGFGQPTRFDALSNFLTNKLTPPVGVVADWLRDRDFKGDPFVIEEALAGAATPITVQQAVELKDNASADRVAGVILDAIGIGSFSIDEKPKKKKSILTESSIGG